MLKDMQRITSEWQSIIFTGSPTSRFQMRTWEGGHTGGGLSPAAAGTGWLSPVCPHLPDGPGRDAPRRVGCAGMRDGVGGFYIKG